MCIRGHMCFLAGSDILSHHRLESTSKWMWVVLNGVAQLVGGPSVKQKFPGLISGEGTCLGYEFSLQFRSL